MSLQTDKVFFTALNGDAAFVAATGGRIYSTDIPVPDEDFDNEPVPYAVVTFAGLQNGGFTKDSPFEGDTDTVTVEVFLTARTRGELAELAEAARVRIREAFAEWDEQDADYPLVPLDYDLTAGAVGYDPWKPCYYQTLSYQCDTNP